MSDIQTNIDKMVSGIREMQEALRVEQERVINNELGPILAQFCEEYNLPGLSLYGYTPGFNDGDPCEHSQDTGEFCDGEDLYGYEFENDEQEELVTNIQRALGEWRSEPRKLVNQLFEPLEEAFHSAFGTDWFLVWEYEPVSKTVIMKRGRYDCGY